MKTKKRILFFLIILFITGSCKDYLEPYPTGIIDDDEMWEYQVRVQGLIGQCYEFMPRNYNDNEGVYLDGATDDAVITNTSHAMHRLATGSLTAGQDPFYTFWDRNYKGIRLVNTFLKDRRGYNTRFLLTERYNELIRNRLQGEAFALRAWFQWDLLQKFGGKGVNGQMLGFPIVTEPLDISLDINLKRDSYDDCVKQIIADCDSALKYLPIAHRDFLISDQNDLVYAGGKYWGRLDGVTMLAIKSMVYLTWASPRFNPANDISRWDSAASNAIKVINFKLTVDNVSNGFNPVQRVNWMNPNFPGIVFGSRWLAANDAMERTFYPGGFQGYGAIGASQELVDAFPDKDGYPITDSRSVYDPADPYLNRDPRFYSTIFYNTAKANKNNVITQPMYTFENWSNGGKDAAGLSSTNSLTNYHIKKFVFMGLNWSDASINRQPHSKFFIRWAHMCLIFAEAANHVVGPTNESRYGMSPLTAVQYIRARETTDGPGGISQAVPNTPDDYLAEVAAAGQIAFDQLVRNERRIETCFEGLRFYDLQRWSTNLNEFNKDIHGAHIIRNEDLSFTYNLNYKVESREFSSAYLPIPYTEILKMGNLVQNEGWDGWN